MAHQYSLPLLALFCFLFLSAKSINAGNITTYWGQNGDEGNLTDACSTGNYEIINIDYLNVFGAKETPSLNISSHCSEDCSWMAVEIIGCQLQGVKVFLSLGGSIGSYALASTDYVREVATYLWDNFLGGESDSRPLGQAVLDGIDFNIQESPTAFWYELAKILSDYILGERKVYLSASPQCLNPDHWLETAINEGLFDYVWVQFYNNIPCQYGINADALLYSWVLHWESIKASKLFLGLPASPKAVSDGGYIPPKVLISKVLPVVNISSKYGGVMLWDRYWDTVTGYSDDIKAYV